MPPNDADKQMDADQEERQALGRVAHALRHYRSGVEPEVARWERNLSLLSPQHRALVPRLPEKVMRSRLQCLDDQGIISTNPAAR